MSMSASSSANKPRPLRLFMLRYGKRGEPVADSNGDIIYFDDKEEAKRQRDELNHTALPKIFVVSNGPDHKRK